MSQKYKPKDNKPTGREYVDYTTEFCNRTTFYCMRLPRRWNEILLQPMLREAQAIESLVTQANKVYVNEYHLAPEAAIRAYQERDRLLHEALRHIDAFNAAFDRMTGYIELGSAEKNRLKKIVLSLIRDAKQEDPDLKKLEIKVVSRMDDVQYESMFGNQYYKLKLTRKDKDRWLQCELAAIQYITDRLDKDKRSIARLKTSIAPITDMPSPG